MNETLVHVDHIVVVTNDLKKAAQLFEVEYGLEVRPGGVHAGVGTENLIVPLSGSYLELAAIVDADLADLTPFGRLVSARLRYRGPCSAAWATTTDERPTVEWNLSHQTLRRGDVEVDLYGADEVAQVCHRPFAVQRDASQPWPGALADRLDRSRRPIGIAAMTVQRSTAPSNPHLDGLLDRSRAGTTAVTYTAAVESFDPGGVLHCEVSWSDGSLTGIDMESAVF